MTRRTRAWAVAVGLAVVASTSTMPAGAQEPPPPTMVVTPTTGLLDRHEVDVALSGLTPGQRYALLDCAADGCVDMEAYFMTFSTLAIPLSERHDPLRRLFVAGDDGTATTTVSLRRSIGLGPYNVFDGPTIDCTAEACTLALVARSDGTDRLAEVPLSFAATGTYQWPAAEASVTPAPPYAHGQALAIEATGFEPDTPDAQWPIDVDDFGVAFLQPCVDDGTGPACEPADLRWAFGGPRPFAYVADDGTASFAAEADRFVRISGTDWRDCSQQDCTLTAFQPQQARSNDLPMGFGPVWAPWPTAEAMVDGLSVLLDARELTASDRALLIGDLEDGDVDAFDVVTSLAAQNRAVGDVATLYASLLKRRPDLPGLDFWTAKLRAGTASAGRVADIFSNTAEVKAQHQGRSDADAVEWAYQSTLGRPSDPVGKAYWVGRLAAGLPRFRMISMFALAPESKVRTGPARILVATTRSLLATVPAADAWATTAPGQAAALTDRLWQVVDTAPAFRGAP